MLSVVFRNSRGWTDQQWADAHQRLRSDGWITADADGGWALTDDGRARREALEIRTDELAVTAYEPIGTEGCERLLAFAPTLHEATEAAGLSMRLPSAPAK